MMRDIVDHHIANIPGARGLLENPSHPGRHKYLVRFADMEGRQYLARFHKQSRNLDQAALLEQIATRAKFLRPRLAASFRTVLPTAGYEEFAGFINRWTARTSPRLNSSP